MEKSRKYLFPGKKVEITQLIFDLSYDMERGSFLFRTPPSNRNFLNQHFHHEYQNRYKPKI